MLSLKICMKMEREVVSLLLTSSSLFFSVNVSTSFVSVSTSIVNFFSFSDNSAGVSRLGLASSVAKLRDRIAEGDTLEGLIRRLHHFSWNFDRMNERTNRKFSVRGRNGANFDSLITRLVFIDAIAEI